MIGDTDQTVKQLIILASLFMYLFDLYGHLSQIHNYGQLTKIRDLMVQGAEHA